MIPKDKTLYHQIHPFKLFVDFSTGFLAVYFFWLHDVVTGLIVAFVPSLVISFIMIWTMDFTKQKNSPLGKYVARFMTRQKENLRLVGFLVMLAGGWYQSWGIIIIGFAVVLYSWTYGLLYKSKA
ncbi:MAG: hypothetical protein KGJ59_07755 [Bacteroidota bacterium]|nr:hypothetical protein [Bacteroidota bacterium]